MDIKFRCSFPYRLNKNRWMYISRWEIILGFIAAHTLNLYTSISSKVDIMH